MDDEYMPEDGFTIGGNAAAGCANLHAAVEEEKSAEDEGPSVKAELLRKCLIVRWCDDLAQFWDWSISVPGHRMLMRLRDKWFYKKPLELEPESVKQIDTFGFRTNVAGGVLRVRAAAKK